MTGRQFLLLILLGAIWGSSFVFMRIAVPQLTPAWTLEGRLLSAALVLLLVSAVLRKPLHLRQHWRHYLILGVFNTAIPFFAYAWAALTLPASLLSILNSTAPLFGVIIGFVWRGKPITPRAVLGLVLGISGVITLVGLGGLSVQSGALAAVVITLAASACYGWVSNYAETAVKVESYANTHGSLWAAFLVMLPILAATPAPASWPTQAVVATLVLGLLCTGVAYLMYFHLIATAGAPAALTVGYLIPLWGVLWGWLFLNEAIGWHTLFGAGLVLAGTVLVTGFNPGKLLRRSPQTV